jgi:hypothetical protein
MNVGALGLGALALEGGADDRMGEAERVTTLEHSRSHERVRGLHRLPGADTGELDRVPELGAVTQPGYGAGKLERVRAEAPQSHVNARGDGPGRELEDGRPPRVVRPHSACGEVRGQRIEQKLVSAGLVARLGERRFGIRKAGRAELARGRREAQRTGAGGQSWRDASPARRGADRAPADRRIQPRPLPRAAGGSPAAPGSGGIADSRDRPTGRRRSRAGEAAHRRGSPRASRGRGDIRRPQPPARASSSSGRASPAGPDSSRSRAASGALARRPSNNCRARPKAKSRSSSRPVAVSALIWRASEASIASSTRRVCRVPRRRRSARSSPPPRGPGKGPWLSPPAPLGARAAPRCRARGAPRIAQVSPTPTLSSVVTRGDPASALPGERGFRLRSSGFPAPEQPPEEQPSQWSCSKYGCGDPGCQQSVRAVGGCGLDCCGVCGARGNVARAQGGVLAALALRASRAP